MPIDRRVGVVLIHISDVYVYVMKQENFSKSLNIHDKVDYLGHKDILQEAKNGIRFCLSSDQQASMNISEKIWQQSHWRLHPILP